MYIKSGKKSNYLTVNIQYILKSIFNLREREYYIAVSNNKTKGNR
jgi:hypothetical protein